MSCAAGTNFFNVFPHFSTLAENPLEPFSDISSAEHSWIILGGKNNWKLKQEREWKNGSNSFHKSCKVWTDKCLKQPVKKRKTREAGFEPLLFSKVYFLLFLYYVSEPSKLFILALFSFLASGFFLFWVGISSTLIMLYAEVFPSQFI